MRKIFSISNSLFLLTISFLSILYFFATPDLTYIFFTLYIITISIIALVTSFYSLDAHASPLACISGCILGSSILFISFNVPVIHFSIGAQQGYNVYDLYAQSYLIFVILICFGLILTFKFYDKPVVRKKLCYSYVTASLVIFIIHQFTYSIYLKNCTPIYVVIPNLLNLLDLFCILTLIYLAYIIHTKQLLKSPKFKSTTLSLLLLSGTVILSYMFLYYNLYHLNYLFMLTHCIIIFLVLKQVLSDSILQYSKELSDKLKLHSSNTAIMNSLIKHSTLSKENLEKKYAYLDQLYAQMIKFYPDALFVIINHDIYHVNTHACKLLNTTNESDLLFSRFETYIHPDSLDLINKTIIELYHFSIDFKVLQAKLVTLKGNMIDVEIYLTRSLSEDPRAIIASIKDISDKLLEDKLKHAIELEKLKVEFFCTISHELKTPVNIIYSATQLQNNFLEAKEYDRIPTYNEMINQNCMRLLRLLNNFLDVNRLDSAYFKVNPRTLNIVQLTESVLDSSLSYMERKGITVLFDTEEEEIYCSVDQEMMERILLNLLSNAIKYGNTNGNIWVTIALELENVRIHIKDDGVGIAPKNIHAIFERFIRIENGLTRQAEGSGIGLSLVKSFVELNKGTIAVESAEGVGTEFIITLPIETDLSHLDDADELCPTSSEKADIEFSDIYIA